ncbi:transposase [Streptomyces sp. NPDC014623]|uniref:transposase n=1 Tax=Streptomyces sp. NPDC014623 TaxID=3364875 RepID=UPI0036F87285
MHILTEIKNRGVNAVLMPVRAGLKDPPEVVERVWPRTIVRTCVVHLPQSSFRCAARQDGDRTAGLLKPVCTAPAEEAALDRLAESTGTMGPESTRRPSGSGRTPARGSPGEARGKPTPFLRPGTQIRRTICTANALAGTSRTSRPP